MPHSHPHCHLFGLDDVVSSMRQSRGVTVTASAPQGGLVSNGKTKVSELLVYFVSGLNCRCLVFFWKGRVSHNSAEQPIIAEITNICIFE